MSTKEELEEDVSYLLDDGWELQGGVSVTVDASNTWFYMQAMTSKSVVEDPLR